jgi:hypothetical protein
MLAIPTKGFARSVRKHNVRLDVLCDWIEGSIYFDDRALSSIDIADVLIEEEIYVTEDFAREMVMNAWAELRRRQYWIGSNCAFTLDNRWIQLRTRWQDVPAHAFCILLSLAPYYDWWMSQFGHDYTEQGELFEQLTKASLEAQFSFWEIHQTGWTRTNASGLRQVVNEVVIRLGEQLAHFEQWDQSSAKEMGLDLLCYRQFPDNRVGIPVYLMQCASGGDWKSKLKTPDLDVWNDMVRFRNCPQRAFAAPFAFTDNLFTQNCVFVKGLLLDRCRLLGASRYDEAWVSHPLRDRLIAWAEPRVTALLRRSM